ncbi:hypothetical protein ACW0JT_07495 [Arthrobacter sp. SA17]
MRSNVRSGLQQVNPQLPRRAVLRAGAALGLAGMTLPTIGACSPGESPENLMVAGGEPGGFYLEFATLLAESLRRHGVARNAVPVTTGGSLENIDRLLAGERQRSPSRLQMRRWRRRPQKQEALKPGG